MTDMDGIQHSKGLRAFLPALVGMCELMFLLKLNSTV